MLARRRGWLILMCWCLAACGCQSYSGAAAKIERDILIQVCRESPDDVEALVRLLDERRKQRNIARQKKYIGRPTWQYGDRIYW